MLVICLKPADGRAACINKQLGGKEQCLGVLIDAAAPAAVFVGTNEPPQLPKGCPGRAVISPGSWKALLFACSWLTPNCAGLY